MIRYVSWNGWRVLFRISGLAEASSSSAAAVVGIRPSPCSEPTTKVSEPSEDASSTVVSPQESQTDETSTSESKPTNPAKYGKSSIVAAAFASLKSIDDPKKRFPSLDESIAAAGSVESLLSVADAPQLSRRYALRIVSQLADWTTSGRAKLSDFEADTRFVKLCRLLGRGLPHSSRSFEKETSGMGDLAVVLGVTGDDEAAKLVAGVSMNQMIRVREFWHENGIVL
jgi:hypothetical protein